MYTKESLWKKTKKYVIVVAKRSNRMIIFWSWGYFSKNKDGQKHQICLCESCYDRWIQTFKLAPEIEEVTELM